LQRLQDALQFLRSWQKCERAEAAPLTGRPFPVSDTIPSTSRPASAGAITFPVPNHKRRSLLMTTKIPTSEITPAHHATDDGIGSDLLKGVNQISKFIDEDERTTYYLLEKRRIPAGKMGGKWVASKRKIRARYDKLTGEV
jgi:hypothetical protein